MCVCMCVTMKAYIRVCVYVCVHVFMCACGLIVDNIDVVGDAMVVGDNERETKGDFSYSVNIFMRLLVYLALHSSLCVCMCVSRSLSLSLSFFFFF